MEFDLLPNWCERFIWLHHDIFRVMFAISAVMVTLTWLKFYLTPNGKFRRALLVLFGVAALEFYIQIFIYHPVFNLALQSLIRLPRLLTHWWFALFIIRHYGLGGKEERQPAPPLIITGDNTAPGSPSPRLVSQYLGVRTYE